MYKWRYISMWELINVIQWVLICIDWQELRRVLPLWAWHFYYIIIHVVTGVNASWHVCLSCQLLELLFDNSNCECIITFKVDIYSLRVLLLHLHVLQVMYKYSRFRIRSEFARNVKSQQKQMHCCFIFYLKMFSFQQIFSHIKCTFSKYLSKNK